MIRAFKEMRLRPGGRAWVDPSAQVTRGVGLGEDSVVYGAAEGAA
jgi:hypothetical protein